MDFVPYAVPFFLLLILLEFCWGWLKGNNTYRVNDSLNSLSLGLLSVALWPDAPELGRQAWGACLGAALAVYMSALSRILLGN